MTFKLPTPDDNLCQLTGKVALVTGAGRGIGRQIALSLAKNGATIAACSRTLHELASLQEEIEKLHSSCLYQTVDVKKEKAIVDFVNEVNSKLGKIDIVVNNAGIYRTEPVSDHSLATWHEVMDTNLTSALITCRHTIKGMCDRSWGRIVNISSISGKVAEAFGAAYSASKFAMIGLTQALALEVARQGVTVNAVCPGWVDTKMANAQLEDPSYLNLTEQEPSQAKEIAQLSSPQLRFIDPAEVAGLVVYLCSESARGITGQAINICGGLSLH